MRAVLISYDLNNSGKDYTDVHEYIKGQGTWWHHLESTWILRTEKPVRQIRDEIKAAGLDGDDELLVVELKGAAAWTGFSSRGSEWLKKHLS